MYVTEVCGDGVGGVGVSVLTIVRERRCLLFHVRTGWEISDNTAGMATCVATSVFTSTVHEVGGNIYIRLRPFIVAHSAKVYMVTR